MSTLSAAQLDDLREKAYLVLGLSTDSTAVAVDALTVYYDDAGAATSATVQLASNTLTITDSVAGATAFDLTAAANDTLSELATAIDAVANWVPQVVTDPDATSTDLQNLASQNAFGAANEVTFTIINSELIDLLITNIWAQIETGLRRDLLSTSFSEVYDLPLSSGTLTLKQPTVTSIDGVFTESTNGLTVKYTGAGTHARVEVTDTAVVLTSRVGATTTTTTTLFSAQATTTAMASTLNAVAGWTASVITDGPSAYLIRRGAVDAKDTTVTLEAWNDTYAEYLTDYNEGLVTFDGWWTNYPCLPQIRVDYTAGYASIPADVEQCLLDAVKASWEKTSQTAGLKSERLGDYAYEVMTDSDVQRAVQGAGYTAAQKLFTKYARVLP